MIIRVDLAAGATVEDAEVLTAFHAASSTADSAQVGAAMGDAGLPAGEGHVWVAMDWVRAQVRPRVDDSWSADFDAMVEYAASKGWLNDAGTHIKAHIELE